MGKESLCSHYLVTQWYYRERLQVRWSRREGGGEEEGEDHQAEEERKEGLRHLNDLNGLNVWDV